MLAKLREIESPRDRLETLFTRGIHETRDARLYVPLSAATDSAMLRATLRRVAAKRIAFIHEAFREMGLGTRDARNRAVLCYAAYVGFLHLAREAPEQVPSAKEVQSYVRHTVETLVDGAAK